MYVRKLIGSLTVMSLGLITSTVSFQATPVAYYEGKIPVHKVIDNCVRKEVYSSCKLMKNKGCHTKAFNVSVRLITDVPEQCR